MLLFNAMKDVKGIITRQEMEKLNFMYQKQQIEIKKRLEFIKEGAKFGYLDGWDGYYPSTFMEVLDEETGLIRFLEPSINKVHEDSVLNIYIVGEDKF